MKLLSFEQPASMLEALREAFDTLDGAPDSPGMHRQLESTALKFQVDLDDLVALVCEESYRSYARLNSRLTEKVDI